MIIFDTEDVYRYVKYEGYWYFTKDDETYENLYNHKTVKGPLQGVTEQFFSRKSRFPTAFFEYVDSKGPEPCQGIPGCENIGTWQYRNTAYAYEPMNVACFCESCAEDDYLHFKEMWDEYYSSRM